MLQQCVEESKKAKHDSLHIIVWVEFGMRGQFSVKLTWFYSSVEQKHSWGKAKHSEALRWCTDGWNKQNNLYKPFFVAVVIDRYDLDLNLTVIIIPITECIRELNFKF